MVVGLLGGGDVAVDADCDDDAMASGMPNAPGHIKCVTQSVSVFAV